MKKKIVLAALLLTACNREEQPQAPTAAESERLNEAEEMLNAMAGEEESADNRAGQSLNR